MSIDKNPKILGSMFDRIAPSYDTLNTILSFGIDKLWRSATIRHLDIRPGHLVLDIATGTGEMALRAERQCDCRVVGIDFSRNMLARAQAKDRSGKPLSRVFLVRGDALSMPFPDTAFDRAMTSFGIRNVTDVERLCCESFRVLKRGGRMAILEFSLPSSNPLKKLYLLYFAKVIPFMGGVISGDFAAYRYLRDSVIAFSTPRELETVMRRAGFALIRSRSMFFGITHLFVLEKQ